MRETDFETVELRGLNRAIKRLETLANSRVRENVAMHQIRENSRQETLANRTRQRRINEQMLKVRTMPEVCAADTPRCPEARNMLLDTPECCKAHVRRIMADVAALMDRDGIRWWVDYGTLLGWIRHGGMIPWDKDGDLGVLGEDRDKLLGLQEEWLGMGYHATFAPVRPTQRFRTGDRMKVRLSRRNWTNVDIFIWHKRPGGILDRKNYIGADLYKGREFPRSWALPLQRGEWDGINVSVPAEPELLAKHRYGASWQEPLREKHPSEVRR